MTMVSLTVPASSHLSLVASLATAWVIITLTPACSQPFRGGGVRPVDRTLSLTGARRARVGIAGTLRGQESKNCKSVSYAAALWLRRNSPMRSSAFKMFSVEFA